MHSSRKVELEIMRLEAGKKFGQWTLIQQLGKGGNGTVWKVRGSDGNEAAIKIFHDKRNERYQRFRDEVATLRRLKDCPGVMPILDAHLPEHLRSDDPAWLAMPIAAPISSHLQAAQLEEIVSAVQEIADTLASIAAEGISHRDIKPDNLFWYEGRATVGDFGLVQFPDKEAITQSGEKLGPAFYIAPEMLLDAVNADGRPADVYSLAKTLWVLATGQKFPVPGEQHVGVPGQALSSYVSHPRANALDLVIEHATRYAPSDRTTMAKLSTDLLAWSTYRQKDIVQEDLTDLINRVMIATAPASRGEEQKQIQVEIVQEVMISVRERLSHVENAIDQLGSGDEILDTPYYQKLTLAEHRAIGSPHVTWSASMIYKAKTPGAVSANLFLPIIFELLDDGNLGMTAMYWLGQGMPNGKVIWRNREHKTWTAPLASTESQQDCDVLIQMVTEQLHPMVEEYVSLAEALSSRRE